MKRKLYSALLTVTSFKSHTGHDAVHNDEADNVTAVILNEAFELLNLLLDWVPSVLLALRFYVHVWGVEAQPVSSSELCQCDSFSVKVF